MTITKQEAGDLRRETSLLGQQNNLSDMYEDYFPAELSIQQALQEGLSIITNPCTLDFHHTKEIYIKPELIRDEPDFESISQYY